MKAPLRSGCDCKILQLHRIQNSESRIQELQAKGLCPGSGRAIEFIFYDTTLESTYLRKAGQLPSLLEGQRPRWPANQWDPERPPHRFRLYPHGRRGPSASLRAGRRPSKWYTTQCFPVQRWMFDVDCISPLSSGGRIPLFRDEPRALRVPI